MWSSRITPTAMLPPIVQPMPPNILRSTTPGPGVHEVADPSRELLVVRHQILLWSST